MFAVYRTDGDGYTYSYDAVLFVTADEQVAKDSVCLAQLELEEARKVAVPKMHLDLDHLINRTTNRTIDVLAVPMDDTIMERYDVDLKLYNDIIRGIHTVDAPAAEEENMLYYTDKYTYYYYAPVKVR